MIEKLQSKQNREYFFTIIILLLLLIFCIRYLFIPYLNHEPIVLDEKLLNDTLDKFFTSTLVTVGLATFIFWLTPKNKLNAEIKIIQPVEINNTITNARIDTERWWFNGGSGRYTRSVTLPYLASLARRKNQTIDVTIQIMNPSNEDICLKYADYRNSLRTSNINNKKTAKSVQIDLVSTIVSAYMWKSEQPQLEITLGLKDNFSLFRTDLSSRLVLITKEDPIEPAILYDQGTFFYSAHFEDLKQNLNQINKLDMNIKFVGKSKIDLPETKNLLTKIGFASLFSDSEIISIIENAKSESNPYA